MKPNPKSNALSDQEFSDWVKKLQEKYLATGQDLNSYLEGLYHQDFLNYWDYIHLDTLLTLQIPRTNFADEEIFIIYHQITELYFKLCLLELKQLSNVSNLLAAEFLVRINRVNRYFDNLVRSFEVMIEGMNLQDFLKFRMALLPASGFQSLQYRQIELACTAIENLLDMELRYKDNHLSLAEKMERLYWKKGAMELASGEKTLTLKRFEEKYGRILLDWAQEFETKNLSIKYQQLPDFEENKEKVIKQLRMLDEHVNVNWPLAHYKSAVRYLNRKPAEIAATGGTNWQKYLPPRFQKRIFFPELWNENEIKNWGKKWVENALVQPF